MLSFNFPIKVRYRSLKDLTLHSDGRWRKKKVIKKVCFLCEHAKKASIISIKTESDIFPESQCPFYYLTLFVLLSFFLFSFLLFNEVSRTWWEEDFFPLFHVSSFPDRLIPNSGSIYFLSIEFLWSLFLNVHLGDTGSEVCNVISKRGSE